MPVYGPRVNRGRCSFFVLGCFSVKLKRLQRPLSYDGVVVASAYDTASRLTSLTYIKGATTLGNLTYTYDKTGKRIATGGSFARTGLPPAIATATYNAANHQLTLGNKSATYDNNGNLTTLTDPSGTTTYTWNVRNQLASLNGPGIIASFQYDATWRRKQKTINGTTTTFLYDDLDIIQEKSGTSTVNFLRGVGADEKLTRSDGVGQQSFLAGPLGSILATADGSGMIQTEYTYDPFGATTTSGAAMSNAFRYTGREDDGTKLYYYRARYYFPELQRFIIEDPIGFAGGSTNLFSYVKNNPVNLRDPLGTAPCDNFCGPPNPDPPTVYSDCNPEWICFPPDTPRGNRGRC